MTRHRKGCCDIRCAAAYGLPIGEAKFFCQGCEKWVGFCVSRMNSDTPELCDVCAAHVQIWRNHARRFEAVDT